MPSNASAPMMRSFAAGALATLTAVYLSNRLLERRSVGRSRRRSRSTEPFETAHGHPVSANAGSDVIDDPSLENRILRKAEAAIVNRTSQLTVVIERCTNDHNYSAILRTVEALGIQNVWIVCPPVQSTLVRGDNLEGVEAGEAANGGEDVKLVRSTGQAVRDATPADVQDRAMHHLFARKAMEWLTVREFDDTASCVEALRESGHTIWSTDLGQVAVKLTRKDLLAADVAEGLVAQGTSDGYSLPRKLAIVFGTEAVGCTAEMLSCSDRRVYLPLRGFADSLNLSVATALVVHQLFNLDPSLIGSMTEQERTDLRKFWYKKLARQRIATSGEKKNMARIMGYVKAAEAIERKVKNGENVQVEQRRKLDKLPHWQSEIRKMNDDLDRKAELSVREMVYDPPEPLGDMRRCDEHRACYVGRNTKKRNDDAWKDMPATTNYSGEGERGKSAGFFRSRAEASQSGEAVK